MLESEINVNSDVISDVISDFVIQAEPDLIARLDYQAEALQEIKCINEVWGRWINAYDVNYLLSVLALKDKDFAEMFPAAAHTSEMERQRFSVALETHIEQCTHCSLKRGYDLEMDARLEQACQQNDKLLLQILEEDEAYSSEEIDMGIRS